MIRNGEGLLNDCIYLHISRDDRP